MALLEETNQSTWAVKPCSWVGASRIAKALGIPQVAAMVLAGRGLDDPAAAREFLDCAMPLPDPFLFADMKAAVAAIASAVDERRKIVVHGDYDADGITATALMVLGLREMGADVDWYLPSRFEEGYGLSRQAVEAIAVRQASVLVTVDCGVNYPGEVALARDMRMEVVVVDHHEPGPLLPDCHLIHHIKGAYPHGDLCGVGLALKVLHALHIGRSGAEASRLPAALMQYLDLVAIGTVADLASLKGENRYYVKEGLRLLNLGQRVGLRALAEVANCGGAVDSGSVAFRLAPRLNAAGRLADASPPLRLLLSEDEGEAKVLAGELHELNGARQDLERTVFDAAVKQVEAFEGLPLVIVLAAQGWHQGVVGIVASRIVEQYHRPAVLLGVEDGVAKGSGRSIPGYDLLGGLTACENLLTIYGGHAQAAGLTMKACAVEEFREAIQRHAEALLAPRDLAPVYRADAVLAADDLSTETALALARLEPFGQGNPRPRFMLVDARLENAERTRNGLHLRGKAEVGGVRVPAIGFGMGQTTAVTERGQEPCVLGAQLRTDEWQGSVRIQLVLERVEPFLGKLHGEAPCGPLLGTTGTMQADTPASVEPGQATAPAAAARDWPSAARDLRGRPGRITALAQVLATQESILMLASSAGAALERLWLRLPLDALFEQGVSCLERSAIWSEDSVGALDHRVLVSDWETALALKNVIGQRLHMVALEPAFRPAHLGMVSDLSDLGTTVHLLYGDEEKAAARKTLRYLVHPRFAMVCLYKAMRQGGHEDPGAFSLAAQIGWEEARVMLTRDDLTKAQVILGQLGLERVFDGKAKLDARENAAYRDAEVDYEECVSLCLSL